MEDVGKNIGKIATFVFAFLLICYTSYLTFMLAQRMIPNSLLMQIMTLVLFDVSAVVWFVSFISQARGSAQWSISAIGFFIGLVGSVTMAGGELILGQQLVIIEDPSKLGWVLISTIIVAALTHVSLIYAFHFFDPDVRNKVEMAISVGKAMESARKNAQNHIKHNQEELSQAYMDAVIAEAKELIHAEVEAKRKKIKVYNKPPELPAEKLEEKVIYANPPKKEPLNFGEIEGTFADTKNTFADKAKMFNQKNNGAKNTNIVKPEIINPN